MEVKKGYQQTTVGMIPSDWEVKEFGDIVTIRRQKYYSHISGPHDFCVELEHIEQESGNLNGYTKTSPSSSIKNVFQKNDILFGKLRAYLRKYWKANKDGVSSSEIWVFVAKDDFTTPEYVFQIVQTDSFIESASEACGTHMPRSDWNIVRKKVIPLPSTKAEQEKIAEALSDADALIESLEKVIAKKRNIKQGTRQELLARKKRLSGFSGKWEVKKLGEITKVKTGNKNNEDNVEEGSYPFFVRSQHIKKINTYSFDGEAILIPGEGGIGTIIHYINGKFDYHQRVYKISNFSDDSSGKYVFYSMMQNFRKQAMINSVKATVDSLRLPTFLEFEIKLPSKEEQVAIAQILSNMDTEIEQLEQKLNKYRMVKQGMMQQLLTGKIRLVDKSFVNAAHSWEFDEAVVVSVIVNTFGKKEYPLGRKRYTKFSYLLNRHSKRKVEGYLKKAAGPYNPKTRYGGPEKIALSKRYISSHSVGKYFGYIASDNIIEAVTYFTKWYGVEALKWLEQFRYKTNDQLELLTTVDMAMQDLLKSNRSISVANVKTVIQDNEEWRPKLERPIFSDDNISLAIKESQNLFGL